VLIFADNDQNTVGQKSADTLRRRCEAEGKRVYPRRRKRWLNGTFSGDYFENCNCSVVCPCLVSKAAPLTSRPTEGVCDVAFIIHVETGRHDGVALDGLNAGSVCEVLAGLGRGPSFYVVVRSGHRSAPRVVAALARLVHDRQSAADYECNHDNNN
jgi:Protein of unknown function (DUF1326)